MGCHSPEQTQSPREWKNQALESPHLLSQYLVRFGPQAHGKVGCSFRSHPRVREKVRLQSPAPTPPPTSAAHDAHSPHPTPDRDAQNKYAQTHTWLRASQTEAPASPSTHDSRATQFRRASHLESPHIPVFV